MPRASVIRAIAVKAGFFARLRMPYRRSLKKFPIIFLLYDGTQTTHVTHPYVAMSHLFIRTAEPPADRLSSRVARESIRPPSRLQTETSLLRSMKADPWG